MSQHWYIKHNGKVLGPVDSNKLRQLAGAAKIEAATEVRLGDAGEWVAASKVKGLIASEESPPLPPSPQHVASTLADPDALDRSDAINRPQTEPINPYQTPAFNEDEMPIPPTPGTQGLKTTRTGLFAIYYGICAVLLALVGGFLLAVLGASMGVGMAVAAIGVLAGLAVLGGYVSIFVGQILCLTVPQESGGKGYVQIAVAMQALSILLAVGGGITMGVMETSGSVDPSLTDAGSSVLNFVNSLLGIIGYICFLYFMKHVALFIGRHDLASSSSDVMKMIIACAVMLFVVPFIGVVGAFFVGGMSLVLFGVLSLVLLITLLITFIRYANLVGYLARAIPS